jgi:hypothetical protein
VGSEDVDRFPQRNRKNCAVNSFSPDVALSDYHLFGKLKKSLRGTRFKDDVLIRLLNGGSDRPFQSFTVLE